MIKTNETYQKPDYTLVSLKGEQKVFSFLSFMFIGESDLAKHPDYLLKHERVHIRHKHSLDLLWYELLKIIMWFNPFVYHYQRRISAIHEFIADAESVKMSNRETYYNHLLNTLFQVEKIAFINQFYTESLIKNRIVMLTKNKSNQWRKLKYLTLIPVLGILMLSCTQSLDNDVKKSVETNQKITVSDKTVPFNVIEQAPVFPGCEDAESAKAQKKCFSKGVQRIIAENFNIDLAQSLGLEAGKKRLFAMFTIDNTGTVKNIRARAPHTDLEAEAIRVIKLLPKMKPAVANNQYVNVKYSLPITFIVEE